MKQNLRQYIKQERISLEFISVLNSFIGKNVYNKEVPVEVKMKQKIYNKIHDLNQFFDWLAVVAVVSKPFNFKFNVKN